MKSINRSSLIGLLVGSLVGVSVLTACGGRSAGPQVPVKPQTTAVPQNASPQATAPGVTSGPAATTEADPAGDALEQLLQKLDTANASGDSLNDVPEVK